MKVESLIAVAKFVVVVWWAFPGAMPVKAYEASVETSAECGEVVALLAEDFAMEGRHDRVAWAVCCIDVEMIEERRG